MNNVITGEIFLDLLHKAYQNLCLNCKSINDLNVFPVPDGDTGSNMKVTFFHGLENIKEQDNVPLMAEEFAQGMLFGARGNSGVLLSQYFKGIANGLKGKEKVDISTLIQAMIEGYKNAYDSTVVPVEGTILTVAREGIEKGKLEVTSTSDLIDLFLAVYDAMRISLDNTPNLLPVLKDAGVIDSGGKGLLVILEGFIKSLRHEDIQAVQEWENHAPSPTPTSIAFDENSELVYGYCTEFLLQLQNSKTDIPHFDLKAFISFLSEHGDSIVCFQNGSIVKVHIHTKKPYEIIEFAQRYGEFVAFKMENMSLQHNEVVNKKQEKNQQKKERAIIAVCQGEGMKKIFSDLGCDLVLDGSSTMNTSTAEFLDAFEKVNAKTIFLLTNESNLIMSANQAKNLYKDAQVRVIETKTMQEGYFALSMAVLTTENDDELEEMLLTGKNQILSCFIAASSRDVQNEEVHSKKGDYIGYVDSKLVCSHPERKQATLALFSKIENIDEKEICFLMYGKQVSKEEVEEIQKELMDIYPYLEVGILEGKQDVYDILIGVNR